MMDPKVILFRIPAAEEAASRLVQQRTLTRRVSKAKECFLCRTTHINQDIASSQYLEQLKLFKKLVFSTPFRKSLTWRTKSKKFDFDNDKSCAFCLLTVNKIWEMQRRMEIIQKKIEAVIKQTQEAVLTSYLGTGVKDVSIVMPESTLQGAVDDDHIDEQNLMHFVEEDDNNAELDMYSDLESVTQMESELREEDNVGWVEDRGSGLRIGDIGEGVEIKSEVVISEDYCDPAGEQFGVGEEIVIETGPKRRSNRTVRPVKRFHMDNEESEDEDDPEYCEEELAFTEEEGKDKTGSIYKCRYLKCGMSFDTRELQVDHVKTTHKGMFPCLECAAIFPKNSYLTLHKNRVHLKLKRYNCDQCPKKFYDRSDYTRHIRRHTGENTMEVGERTFGLHPDPDFVPEGERSITIALRLSKEKATADRTGGGQETERKEGENDPEWDGEGSCPVNEHPENAGIYKCSHVNCEMRFDTNTSWFEHIKTAHKGVYQCPKCPKDFPKNSYLALHIKRVHLKLKRYNCDQCPKKFYDRADLCKHIIRHNGERPYKCEKCGNGYPSMDYLNIHKRAYCKLSGIDQELRKKLMKKKASGPNLKRPNANHLGETVICDICGKSLMLKQLSIHQKMVHERVKRHMCPEPGCEKAFFKKPDWTRHVALVHKREIAKVQCEECGLEFLHADLLLPHRRQVHMEGLKCDLCPTTFTDPSNLKRHMMTHTGEKPFKCTDCGNSYGQSGTLRKHRERFKGRCQSMSRKRKRKPSERDSDDSDSETEVETEVEIPYLDISVQ